MAQYYTDFSEYAVNLAPSDWTAWLDAQTGWVVVAQSGYGNVLKNTNTNSGQKAITWNAVPETADVEIYFEFGATLGSRPASLSSVARLDTTKNAPGNAHLYRSGYDLDETRLSKYVNGAFTSLLRGLPDLGPSSEGDIFALRYSASGSNLKVRVWNTVSAEPTTWSLETTDTDIIAAGATGLFRFSGFNPNNFWFSAFGVGTGTDPAPTSAVTTSTPTAVAFSGTVPTLNGSENSAFSEDLSGYFSGTETPFNYSLLTGTLPAGLSLDAVTGIISGTPTTVGTSTGLVVRATDATPNTADTNSFSIDIAAADTTAPVLSSPVATQTGQTTADLSVSTDEANGLLYWIVSESVTAPSVAQIQAGNDSAGTAAAASGSQAVSATGVQNASATGLLAGTTYYAYFQKADSAGNDSTVVGSSAFTTASANATVTVTDPLKNNTGTVLASQTGVKAAVLDATTIASIYEATGMTTDASGLLEAISNAAITSTSDYHVVIKLPDGSIGITGIITAT